MSQSCADARIYVSEYQFIRENTTRSSKKPEDLGDLYGFWTHGGNVLVQLAIAPSGPVVNKLEKICKDHRLQIVGKWGTKEPKLVPRRSGLDPSLGFVYIHRSPHNDKLVCYSIPAFTERPSAEITELTPLLTASPFRALEDAKKTEKLKESGLQYLKKNPQPDLKGHWSSKERYPEFLKNLRACFKDAGMEVKQFQQPGSDYIAFQVQSGEAKFAVGFPPDFNKKSKVDFYRDQQAPFEAIIPLDAKKAFHILLTCVSDPEKVSQK
ncbi:uncharacterized protein LOC134182467 [Corticium candelabrum]|uniref:uncharacterized protein LOC134182467 n=1 Tax=Corticium candelabrum TaxID=121492 RepID=UPI002E25E4DE|nr:uncharacterized protein LOC134182467 [Corticium candelabrum]